MGIEDGKLVFRSRKNSTGCPHMRFRDDWQTANRPQEFELQWNMHFLRWNYPRPTLTAANGQMGNYFVVTMQTTDRQCPHNCLFVGGFNGLLERRVIKYAGNARKKTPTGYFFPGAPQSSQGQSVAIPDVGMGPYYCVLRHEAFGGGYRHTLRVGGSEAIGAVDVAGGSAVQVKNVELRLQPFPSSAAKELTNYCEVAISNLRLVAIEAIYSQPFSGGTPVGWTGTLDSGRLYVLKDNGLTSKIVWSFAPSLPLTGDWYLSFDFWPDPAKWGTSTAPNGSQSDYNGFWIELDKTTSPPGSGFGVYAKLNGPLSGTGWKYTAGWNSEQVTANVTAPIHVLLWRVGSSLNMKLNDGETATGDVDFNGEGPASVARIQLRMVGWSSGSNIDTPGWTEPAAGWIDNVLLTRTAQ